MNIQRKSAGEKKNMAHSFHSRLSPWKNQAGASHKSCVEVSILVIGLGSKATALEMRQLAFPMQDNFSL